MSKLDDTVLSYWLHSIMGLTTKCNGIFLLTPIFEWYELANSTFPVPQALVTYILQRALIGCYKHQNFMFLVWQQ